MLKKRKKILFFIGLAAFFSLVVIQFLFFRSNLSKPLTDLSLIYAFSKNDTLPVATLSEEGLKCENEEHKSYCEYVLEESAAVISKEQNISLKKAEELVRKGGFDIYTFLDTDVTKNVLDVYSAIEPFGAQSAMAVSDLNGRLLCIMGGLQKTQTNYAVQGRFAGSSMKSIGVYAPLIDSKKAHWSTQFLDLPLKKISNTAGQSNDWPQNFDGKYSAKPITVCEGIERSLNTIAARALDSLTVSKSMDFLETIGVDITAERQGEAQNDNAVMSALAFGYLKKGISVCEMTGCYQIFANGGLYTAPHTVEKIQYNKKDFYTAKKESMRVISGDTATIMNRLLQNVINGKNGTANAIQLKNIVAGGKTGTSQNNKDRWFAGFTPYYVSAVWWGYDDEQPHPDGPSPCLKIFQNVMQQLHADLPEKDFLYDEGVLALSYCTQSGGLAGKGCPLVQTGYYQKDNTPKLCPQH